MRTSPSSLCLYSVAGDKRLTFISFDPMQGTGQEVAHIDDELPYAFNWSLSPDGSTLAIAKANKLDIIVQPEIRLLTLKDGKERRIALKDWSSINCTRLDGRWKGSVGQRFQHYRHQCTVECGPAGRARPVWEQTKMAVGWAIPSPDGRYLAMWQASGNANVWMVENF